MQAGGLSMWYMLGPSLPCAGGHNVIAGLFDHLQSHHPGSRLLGFLNGPRGVLNAVYHEITAQQMVSFLLAIHVHMLCID